MSRSKKMPWLLRWSGLLVLCLLLFVGAALLAQIGIAIAGSDFVLWISSNPSVMMVWRLLFYGVCTFVYLVFWRKKLLMATTHDHDDGAYRRRLLPRLERVAIVAIIVFEIINMLQKWGVM